MTDPVVVPSNKRKAVAVVKHKRNKKYKATQTANPICARDRVRQLIDQLTLIELSDCERTLESDDLEWKMGKERRWTDADRLQARRTLVSNIDEHAMVQESKRRLVRMIDRIIGQNVVDPVYRITFEQLKARDKYLNRLVTRRRELQTKIIALEERGTEKHWLPTDASSKYTSQLAELEVILDGEGYQIQTITELACGADIADTILETLDDSVSMPNQRVSASPRVSVETLRETDVVFSTFVELWESDMRRHYQLDSKAEKTPEDVAELTTLQTVLNDLAEKIKELAQRNCEPSVAENIMGDLECELLGAINDEEDDGVEPKDHSDSDD